MQTQSLFIYTFKIDAESCVNAMKSSISLFRVPNRIIADQARCFTSFKFSDLCKSQKISLHLFATGEIRANQQVEWVMSMLKNLLSVLGSSQQSWQDALGEVKLTLNCKICRVTEACPLEVLIGQYEFLSVLCQI